MSDALRRFFGEGFRVFFLLAALYAIFAVSVWVVWLMMQDMGYQVQGGPFAPPPQYWHAHEMIFGYVSAVLAGFLMSAPPVWARRRGFGPLFFVFAAALWGLGRIALWVSGNLPPGVVALCDLAFLLLVMARVGAPLLKRPNRQSTIMLGILTLVWLGNLLVHLDWLNLTPGTAASGLRAGLFGLCALIAVLGGRVAPGMTRNAMKRADLDPARWPRSPIWLERACLALTVLVPIAVLLQAPAELASILALAAGALHLPRVALWRPFWTWREPLLWALHLPMASLGIGLILWGLAGLGLGSEVGALHVLGIGTIGGMTLAVMSRSILGQAAQSGQTGTARAATGLTFGLVALSAVLRWLGADLAADAYFPMLLAAGAVWVLAYGLFLGAMGPILLRPRKSRTPAPQPPAG